MRALFPRNTVRCGMAVFITFLFVSNLPAEERVSGESAKGFIAYLASDALEGRDTGKPGYNQAAVWVARHFEEWGLVPGGVNGAYLQDFPFRYYESRIEYPMLTVDGRVFSFDDGDFRLLRYSGGGRRKAEVVFVGYGISDEERGLDEYENVDVRGKIVLVMRGCPNDDCEDWGGADTDGAKASAAQDHGAVGMLLFARFTESDRSPGYDWRLEPSDYREGFFAFGVDARVVRHLLRDGDESSRAFVRRMSEHQRRLDRELKPMSFATGKKASMEAKIEYDPDRTGKNVIGMIRGADPSVSDEAVVLGAHLDHLGIRYGQIYNGADDNASGSAVVMEVARVMMANGEQPRRSIVFACWGGEERGLLGSRFYVYNPPIIPIEKTVVNFNLDMVGLGSKMGFTGVYYAPEVWELIASTMDEEALEKIAPGRGGPGGSDHTAFMRKGVPAFFLEGSPWRSHPDYHRPGDDTEKINVALLEQTAEFLYDKTLMIANHQGSLIEPHRQVRFVHRNAVVVNVHPIPYESGLPLLESLEEEHVDIQFVDVPYDPSEDAAVRLAGLIETVDMAVLRGDPFAGSMRQLFSSGRENTAAILGIHGVAGVGGRLSHLRTIGRLGIKYFALDGIDGQWVTEEGITETGQEAIDFMNQEPLLILVQSLEEPIMEQLLEASGEPVILCVDDVQSLSDPFLDKVEEDGSLIALPHTPGQDVEILTATILALKDRIETTRIVLYPYFGASLRIEEMDRMFGLSIALHDAGLSEQDIQGILGGHFRSVMGELYPAGRRRF